MSWTSSPAPTPSGFQAALSVLAAMIELSPLDSFSAASGRFSAAFGACPSAPLMQLPAGLQALWGVPVLQSPPTPAALRFVTSALSYGETQLMWHLLWRNKSIALPNVAW